jgi:excisionase family DNA binding protein
VAAVEVWLTVPEVADRLGVKHSAVRKAIARGVLPARRVTPGRFSTHEHLVLVEDVDRYRRDHSRPRMVQS